MGEVSLLNFAHSMNPDLDVDGRNGSSEGNDVGDNTLDGIDDEINDDVDEVGKLEFT